jgi:hypothetical protein
VIIDPADCDRWLWPAASPLGALLTEAPPRVIRQPATSRRVRDRNEATA